MFYIAPNNKILLTRGDSAELSIRIYDKEGGEVEILPSDVIKFTMKRGATPALVKTAELNSIFFFKEDTENLSTGIYAYEVEFTRDGETQTIIYDSLFDLKEEL